MNNETVVKEILAVHPKTATRRKKRRRKNENIIIICFSLLRSYNYAHKINSRNSTLLASIISHLFYLLLSSNIFRLCIIRLSQLV